MILDFQKKFPGTKTTQSYLFIAGRIVQAPWGAQSSCIILSSKWSWKMIDLNSHLNIKIN